MTVSHESAFLDGVLAHLKNASELQSVFGDNPRIVDAPGRARLSYPHIRVARHQTENADAQLMPMIDHTLDLHVMTQWGGRSAAREAVGVVRGVLETGPIMLAAPFQLGWAYIALTDTLLLNDYNTFRSIVRIKARTRINST